MLVHDHDCSSGQTEPQKSSFESLGPDRDRGSRPRCVQCTVDSICLCFLCFCLWSWCTTHFPTGHASVPRSRFWGPSNWPEPLICDSLPHSSAMVSAVSNPMESITISHLWPLSRTRSKKISLMCFFYLLEPRELAAGAKNKDK